MFKSSERLLGWAADYCLICRDLQTHKVVRFHPRGGGTPFHLRQCDECGHRTQVDPSDYIALATPKPQKLVELIQTTNPRLILSAINRANYDRVATEQGLDHPERIQALREPFELVKYRAIAVRPLSHWIYTSLLFVFLCTPLSLLLFTILNTANMISDKGPAYSIFFLACSILTFVISLLYFRRRDLRKVKRAIMPWLTRSLRPLRPTREEITALADWLDFANHPLKKLVVMDDLYDLIRTEPDRSLTNVDSINMFDLAQKMHADLQARYSSQQQQADTVDDDEFPSSQEA